MQSQATTATDKPSVWKVLIVEDSATFRVLYDSFLGNAGYQTLLVSSGEEALQLLDVEDVDIILMDVTMPGLSGFETAKIIRESFPDKWMPIIFITGNEKDEDYQQAIDSGGDDYIIKPVKEAALISKLQAITNILNMQRGLYLAHEELALKNKTDALTGVYSRRFLLDEAESAWRMMRRLGHSLSVLMIDIDNFKAYNDHYGHAGGDACLKKVAATLSHCFTRDTDIVGRLGGEEFLVVLPDTDTIEATKLAENFRKELESQAFSHAKSDRGIVTVSVGCAACHKLGQHNLDGLIGHADDLLYRAKEEGRNCVIWDDFPTSQVLIKDGDDEVIDTETKAPEKPKRSIKQWLLVVVAIFVATIVGRFVASDFSVGDDKYSDIDTVLAEQGVAEQPEPSSASALAESTAREKAPEPVADEEIILAEETLQQVAAESEAAIEVIAEAEAILAESQQTFTEVVVDDIAETLSIVDEAATNEPEQFAPEQVSTVTDQIEGAIEAWLADWNAQKASYLGHYHPEFKDSRGTPYETWAVKRLPKITNPAFIAVTIESLDVTEQPSGLAQAVFIQNYSNDRIADRGEKTLTFKPDANGDWKILSETFKAL